MHLEIHVAFCKIKLLRLIIYMYLLTFITHCTGKTFIDISFKVIFFL